MTRFGVNESWVRRIRNCTMGSDVTPTLMALSVPHVPRGPPRPYLDTTVKRSRLVPDRQVLVDNDLAGTCQAKHVDVVGAVQSRRQPASS